MASIAGYFEIGFFAFEILVYKKTDFLFGGNDVLIVGYPNSKTNKTLHLPEKCDTIVYNTVGFTK